VTDPPLIAIVDDDDEVRAAMESFVSSLGFAVRTFGSAKSFLQSSLVPETACLILDVQMPTMSGIELYSYLLDLGHDIPVIFITAYPDRAEEIRALNAGAVCFLHKPFNEQWLVECLDEALKRRRLPWTV
jgi:FixJ family two-component response regulator